MPCPYCLFMHLVIFLKSLVVFFLIIGWVHAKQLRKLDTKVFAIGYADLEGSFVHIAVGTYQQLSSLAQPYKPYKAVDGLPGHLLYTFI